MSQTRTQLRQLTAKQFGHMGLPFLSGTADSGGSTSTLKDTPIGTVGNDELIGAWIYLSSGSPTATDLRVTDNVQSTGVATFRPTIGAAPDTLTYEVLPFSATSIHEAIDEALHEAYDRGWLARHHWLTHWLTGSPIYNATFDYWDAAATVDGWTVTTATIARRVGVTDHVPVGMNAVRLSAAAGTLALDAPYRTYLQDFAGHSVELYTWAKTGAASNVRAQLVVDGSVVASTSWHSGGGYWELVKSSSYSIAAGASEIYVQFDYDYTSSTTADVGAVWLVGGPVVREYPFPVGLAPDGPDELYTAPLTQDATNAIGETRPRWMLPVTGWDLYTYQEEAGAGELGTLVLPRGVPNERRLWMPVRGPFTLPTTDAGAVELSARDALVIAKMAAVKLVERDMRRAGTALRQQLGEFVARLQREVTAMAEARGRGGSTAARLPRWR